MKTQMNEVAGKKYMVIDTEIPVAAYREGITQLEVELDKETGEVFSMTIDKDAAVGQVSGFGVVANGVIDDNFAILIPVGNEETIEDVKKAYGAKMVKAAAGLAALKASMEAEATAIDEICAGLEEDEVE